MFFVYWQNNSYGKDVIDHTRGIDKVVVIEAADNDAADARALEIGLYFDWAYTIDCDCCGMRWYPAADGYPSFWDYRKEFTSYDMPTYIHYLNGTVGSYNHFVG